MKRLLVLAVLAMLASQADAQLIKFSNGEQKKKSKSGNEPPPLGPWYNYWPLEAHFQTPAMPEYPYWSAPQTVPVVPPAPYGMQSMYPGMQQANPMAMGGMQYPGMMPSPYMGGMPMNPAMGGGYPSAGQQAPAAPATAQPGFGGYPQPNAYPALSGYPGMQPGFNPYGAMPYPYGGYPQPYGAAPQRR